MKCISCGHPNKQVCVGSDTLRGKVSQDIEDIFKEINENILEVRKNVDYEVAFLHFSSTQSAATIFQDNHAYGIEVRGIHYLVEPTYLEDGTMVNYYQ